MAQFSESVFCFFWLHLSLEDRVTLADAKGKALPPRCSDVIQLKLVDISQNHVVVKQKHKVSPPPSNFATKTGKKLKIYF